MSIAQSIFNGEIKSKGTTESQSLIKAQKLSLSYPIMCYCLLCSPNQIINWWSTFEGSGISFRYFLSLVQHVF